ncbi:MULTISPECIES: COG4705 family protein [Frankia]|uniref:COG4705 family protein n=1 Tax=Frankia TaxID=1854 RepID=UPI0005A540C3
MPAASKIPRVTLLFWITKIVATTLGETGGDLLAQTMKVGYAASSVLFIALFLVSLTVQVRADRLHPGLYWTVILATSMAGTTMSDFANRTLGLGYPRGAAILLGLLLLLFAAWWRSGHTFDITRPVTFRVELLYWTAILLSNTLGTSLGDFLSDSSGLGYAGGAALIWSLLAVIAVAWYSRRLPTTLLFWSAFVLTRPMGATLGDLLTKPTARGGLAYGTSGASAILFGVLVLLVVHGYRRQARTAAR